MAARWIAAAIMLVTILIVGIFVSAVFWPPPEVTLSSESGPGAPVSGTKRIAVRGEARTLGARIIQGSTGMVSVTVSITDTEGRPAMTSVRPMAILRMVDMAMAPESVALIQDGPGVWRGSSNLSMAGRWRLHVDVGGESLQVPFTATFQ